MARTKEERLAVQVARDKRRRDEFKTQLAIIESANATREAYAKRERRVRLAEERAAQASADRRNRDLIG
jgi:hypothetical protein